jgi:phosphate acetyltransferase
MPPFFPNTLREAYLTLVNAMRAVLPHHPAMDCQGTHGPIVRARPHDKYLRLIDAARKLSPVTTAIAHPCDEVLLEGVMEARRLRLTEPMLVGPPACIRDVAARRGIDVADLPIADLPIADLPIIESAHSHGSAAKAVALVRQAKAGALMKGSLHMDELMAAVVAHDTGVRTERRISHCFVMDVPGHLDR